MFGRKIIAELAEIDENLIRSQFTPAQEASAIFRRKAIYEELHPDTRHGANQHTRGDCNLQTPSFVEATASATGKDERLTETQWLLQYIK